VNSLIVCLSVEATLDAVADALSAAGTVKRLPDDRLLLEKDGSRVWVNTDNDRELEREYESHELKIIQDSLGEYVCYILNYQDIELAKIAGRILAGLGPAVIDNDRNYFGAGDSFVRVIDRNPEWDWRTQELPKSSRGT
jgi:hypothetical protein